MFISEMRKTWGKPGNWIFFVILLFVLFVITWQAIPDSINERLSAYEKYSGQMSSAWKAGIEAEYDTLGIQEKLEEQEPLSTEERVVYLARDYYGSFSDVIGEWLEGYTEKISQRDSIQEMYKDLMENTDKLYFGSAPLYYSVMRNALKKMAYCMVLMLFVLMTGMFSERENMESLLNVSKYGRKKLHRTKLIVSFFSILIIFFFFLFVIMAVIFIRMGNPPWNGFVQDMIYNYCPYRWNMGEYMLVHIVMLFFSYIVLGLIWFYVTMGICSSRVIYMLFLAGTLFPMMLFEIFKSLPLALYFVNFTTDDYLWRLGQFFLFSDGRVVQLWQVAVAELTLLAMAGIFLIGRHIAKDSVKE